MKVPKNYIAPLLTIATIFITHPIAACQPSPKKRQRINFSTPSDAASLLDIKEAMREVNFLKIKKETKQLNPKTPDWFLNFVYAPSEKTTKSDLDTRADKEVEQILQGRSAKPEGIILKQLGKHPIMPCTELRPACSLKEYP